MINRVIKLNLQYFKHVYVQATCQRDPEVYATCKAPKILTPNLGFLPQNIYRYALGSNLAGTRGWGHSDLETVGDPPGPKMYLHTKYGTATINNIGDLLWVHFFKTWLLRSRSQWLKTVSDIPWPQHISTNSNLGFNMSYILRHAVNTMFCLLSVSCLVGELFLLTHDHYANSMFYK